MTLDRNVYNESISLTNAVLNLASKIYCRLKFLVCLSKVILKD